MEVELLHIRPLQVAVSRNVRSVLSLLYTPCHVIFRRLTAIHYTCSYLDSKSTLFKVINNFRLYDRVYIVSALMVLAGLVK